MEMELDLTTTNTHQQDHNDSRGNSDGDDNEDSIEDEEHFDSGIVDHLPGAFTPQVTLTTTEHTPTDGSPEVNLDPSSFCHNATNDDGTDHDDEEDDSDSSINVDVENIDGTSDNSSLRDNASINIGNNENNDMSPVEDDDDVTDNNA
jgi:hypothetical protein